MDFQNQAHTPKAKLSSPLTSFGLSLVVSSLLALYLNQKVGPGAALAVSFMVVPVIMTIGRIIGQVASLRQNAQDDLLNAELELAIMTGGAGAPAGGVLKNITNKAKGDALEKLVGQCFAALGYEIYDQDDLSILGVLPKHGDQGADRIAVNPVTREAIMIQVKNYSGAVSNKAVQETIAAMAFYGQSFNFRSGMVITNSHFTSSARELAARSGIELMDRQAFANLLAETQPARKAA